MVNHNRNSNRSLEGDERPSKRGRYATTPSPPQDTTQIRPPREVGLMRSVPGDKMSSFIGSSSGIFFIRSVYSAFRSHPDLAATINSPEVPGEDDHLSSTPPGASKRIWRDHEVCPQDCPTIDFDKLVEWSRSYFSNWHPAYPFLHAPAILTLFEKLSQGRETMEAIISSADFIVLRAVMSISLADRRQCKSGLVLRYPVELVFQSYDDAINSVQYAFSQPASMQSLQAVLSVQLFLVSMLRFNAASRLGGLIIRMALQMGLHRCPQRYPAFSPAQRELRQRVFFSLYCIDRFVCQATGLPLTLHDNDIDVCHPTQEIHCRDKSSPDGRLRLLEFLSRHSHIRGEIMEFKHKSIQHAQRETDQSTVIASKLAKLANDVDEFIDFDDKDPPTLSKFHDTLLKILYHESVISLNRPIVASRSSGPVYESALQQCIGSARYIVTLLSSAVASSSRGEQATFSPIWPSFTWAVWMSTFILFHAAATKHVSVAMVTRLADKSLKVLENLACRGSVWPEACGAAIKDLISQLTRNGRHTTQDVDKYAASYTSPYDTTASNDSPHVVGRTMSHAKIPTLAEHAQGGNVADGHNAAVPICQDAQYTGISLTSTQSYNVDNMSMPVDTGVSIHSGEGVPDTGDLSQNGPTLDLPFQFWSNDSQEPFEGFDIPFWLGQDQYSGMINEW